MWQTRYDAHSTASASQVWQVLRQEHTGAINLGGDVFELHGPWAIGSTLSVTPAGQPTMTSVITELVEGERYADRTRFGDLELTFRFVLTAEQGGTLVSHELVIDGPGADQLGPELGPQISADFPEAMAALLHAAEQTSASAS